LYRSGSVTTVPGIPSCVLDDQSDVYPPWILKKNICLSGSLRANPYQTDVPGLRVKINPARKMVCFENSLNVNLVFSFGLTAMTGHVGVLEERTYSPER